MAATERITMTMRELDRFKVIQDVVDGKLQPWRAAERLELTTRQIRRLAARFREHGPAGLVSGHRTKPGNRRLDGDLHVHFTASESTFSYFEATRAYLERYGKPGAFYSDKASVFRSTAAGKTGSSVTHFGRAMYELNIDTFCANSSSAKGRVERAHLTLQDRLVKELRLRGINTVAEANAWAPCFMAAYNARFAKPPKSDFDAHRPLRGDEDLDLLMTWRETRRVTKSLTVQYDRVMYLLDDTPANRKLIHRYIDVWEYPDAGALRSVRTGVSCLAGNTTGWPNLTAAWWLSISV